MIDKQGDMPGGFDKLIDELRKLYLRVSSTLLEKRMDRSALGGGDASDVVIARQLYERIDHYIGQSAPDVGVGIAASDVVAEEGDTGNRIMDGRVDSTNDEIVPNDLSEWIRKEGGGMAMDSSVARKLEANARDHINSALRLARQGRAQEAKLHADLAENTIKTAVNYMSADDYRNFKEKIHERLKNLSPPG